MAQFLVVYRRSTGELLEWEDLGEDRAAAAKRRDERERREKGDPDLEVIVVTAADRKTVMQTHARYFRREIREEMASGDR